MLYLISSDNPDEKYVLLGGKVYVVGRRDADILIPTDAAVSRKHAELTISHTETNLTSVTKLPILRLKDTSKFGTWVNNERVNGERLLQDGDTVYFGSQKSSFMVVYEPLVVTSSCLDNAVKKTVRQHLCILSGHMLAEWQRDCSLLIMSRISVTIKVICALVSQKFVVTPQYIESYVKYQRGTAEKPDASKFTPELVETQLDESEVSFDPDNRRKTLFQGITFYFLSPKQLKKMNLAIELAGGMSMLLEEGKVDKSIIQTGSVVMNYTDTGLTQSSDDWVAKIQNLLDRHNKHMILDAEIGYAVLYCSTEKHCNPDYVSGEDISRLPSQSFSQVEPFVSNTETQNKAQSDRKSQRKRLGRDTQTVVEETKFGEDTSNTQTPGTTQRGQITQNEKSQVVPVVKVKDESLTPTSRPTRKRNRTDEESENPICISKKVKAEPVSVSKSRPTSSDNESSTTKSINSKSSTTKQADDDIVWDSDDGVDYATIETEIPSKKCEQRTSPRQTRRPSPVPDTVKQNKTSRGKSRSRSPVPRSRSPVSRSPIPTSRSPVQRSRSPVQRSRSPVQMSTSPVSMSKSPVSRSKSPVSRSKSPCAEGTLVKVEPATPLSSKISSRSDDGKKGHVSVKREIEAGGQTRSKQEVIDEEYEQSERPDEGEETPLLFDRKSAVNEAAIPAGFLTTRKPIKTQVQRNREYEVEEGLPTGCVHVEMVSLIARRPRRKENGDGDCPEGFTRWKGKLVHNYKKFKKANYAGSQGLPNIIGGSDLEVHVAMRSKELDDWLRESVQTETEHTIEDRRAQDLFDFNPNARRRGR